MKCKQPKQTFLIVFLIVSVLLMSLSFLTFPNNIVEATVSVVDSNITGAYANRAIRLQKQHKIFNASGRIWYFYCNGAASGWKTSTDGSSWSSFSMLGNSSTSPTIAAYFDVYYNGTKVYCAWAKWLSNKIYFRSGTPNSDGTITWDTTSDQLVITSLPLYWDYADPSISVDGSGYPYIGFHNNTSYDSFRPWVTKSQYNNGTWLTASGYPMRITDRAYYLGVKVVPWSGGNMYCVIAKTYLGQSADIIYGRLYNGSWQAEQPISSSMVATDDWQEWDVVSDAYGNIHLIFIKTTSHSLIYIKRNNVTGIWGSEQQVYSNLGDSRAASISCHGQDVYVFWIGYPTTSHIYYSRKIYGESWQSPTDWIDDSTDGMPNKSNLCVSEKSCNNKILVGWLSKTASPYSAKFDSLTVTTEDGTPPTYSNLGVNSTLAGQPCKFYVKWSDNVALSKYRFGTNNTGSWVNDTWTSLSGNPAWSNVTKTLNSTVGVKITYRFWCNDTSNNLADTGLTFLTTSSGSVTIEIYESWISDSRLDYGSQVTIKFRHRYSNNQTACETGTSYVNGTSCAINATGWITYTKTYSVIAKYTFTVTQVNVKGYTTFQMVTSDAEVIWDKLTVTFSADDTSPNVTQTVTISWTITRQYDSSTVSNFIIDISRDGSLWQTLTDNSKNDVAYVDATRIYTLYPSTVTDETYGITIAQANSVTITWAGIPTSSQFTLGFDASFYKIQIGGFTEATSNYYPTNPISVKHNVIFKTSSTLWLYMTYFYKHYTSYCIYVTSPNGSQFTINSWFVNKDGTATLTINSPTSTNINIGFYSPNLLTASATGVVSQTWYSTNHTLLMTVNSAISSTFTITVTVSETAFNTPPENYDVSITNMEGCGNWVFSQTKYYIFQAQYWDGNGYADLHTVAIALTDGLTWINASYNIDEAAYTLLSGSEVVTLQSGTTTILDPNLLQVTFQICFKNTILDVFDVDIYMWCNDTSGASDGWEIKASNYFNIYNLGGHSTLETSGDAGRIAGGDVFDLYAYNQSWAKATLMFRNLQHIKILPMVQFKLNNDISPYFVLTYQVEYCVNDEWLQGYKIVMRNGIGGYVGTGSSRYIGIRVEWYKNDVEIKREFVYFYHTGLSNQNTTYQYWLDLWFNKGNASSIVGGRVNAYYFPMIDTSSLWLQWLTGSNWGVDETKAKQSMFFETMIDDDGNIIHTQQIEMVRVSFMVNCSSTLYSYKVTVSNHDVFDIEVSNDPFVGIQTPVFDETKVIIMPQGGFLGAIYSALSALGNKLAEMFGPAILGFWNTFVGFMDTVFTTFGWHNGFSFICQTITSFLIWVGTALTILLQILTAIFAIIVAGFTTIANVFVGFFSALIGFGNNLVWIWDATLPYWGWIPGVLYAITPLLFFFYLLWAFSPLFDGTKSLSDGIDGTKRNFENTIGIVISVGMFLWKVVDFTIDTFYRAVEMIPVVE